MIYVNLIPRSLWYLNLRKFLGASIWKQVSLSTREAQAWTCQFCHISLKQLKHKKYFHCHEMWEFDDTKNIVKLACLVTLCSHCHLACHIGFSAINNQFDKAFKQIQKVNHWDVQTTKYYLEGCFEEWSRRSNKHWTFDYDSLIPWIGKENKDAFEQNILLNQTTKN